MTDVTYSHILYALLHSHHTIGTYLTEQTSHDMERRGTIMRISENNFRSLIALCQVAIQIITVREAHDMLARVDSTRVIAASTIGTCVNREISFTSKSLNNINSLKKLIVIFVSMIRMACSIEGNKTNYAKNLDKIRPTEGFRGLRYTE